MKVPKGAFNHQHAGQQQRNLKTLTASEGDPVAETPLKLFVKGDLRETKDYHVKLVDLTPGWKIEIDRDLSLWTAFVQHVLYDNRAEFAARPGDKHEIHYRVGSRHGSPTPGVATFELVHVIGSGTDVLLDRYRLELWNDREVSDLSIEASGEPYTGAAGEQLTYTYRYRRRHRHQHQLLYRHRSGRQRPSCRL